MSMDEPSAKRMKPAAPLFKVVHFAARARTGGPFAFAFRQFLGDNALGLPLVEGWGRFSIKDGCKVRYRKPTDTDKSYANASRQFEIMQSLRTGDFVWTRYLQTGKRTHCWDAPTGHTRGGHGFYIVGRITNDAPVIVDYKDIAYDKPNGYCTQRTDTDPSHDCTNVLVRKVEWEGWGSITELDERAKEANIGLSFAKTVSTTASKNVVTVRELLYGAANTDPVAFAKWQQSWWDKKMTTKMDADGECLDQIRFPHITPPWKALLDAQRVAAADGEDGDFEKLTRENAQLKLQLIEKESREKQLQTTIVGLLQDVHTLTEKVEQDATKRAQLRELLREQ